MSNVVPMFPLPDFFLYPQTVAPLHVFEPRYRQMVDDQLDAPGRLVMGTILEEATREIAGSPAVLGVGGLGEIVQHRRLDDGRYLIVLMGLGRVSIDEVPSDRLYRQACVEMLEEASPPETAARRLDDSLRTAIASRAEADFELPEAMDTSQLADLLTQSLTLPQSVREELFTELDVATRAERVLEEYQRVEAS